MTNNELPQVSTECELCDDVYDFAFGDAGPTPERLEQATRHANECHRCRAVYGDDAAVFDLLVEGASGELTSAPAFRRPRRWIPALAGAAAILVVVGTVVLSRPHESGRSDGERTPKDSRDIDEAESRISIPDRGEFTSRALSEFTTVVKLTPKGPQILATAHVRRTHEKE